MVGIIQKIILIFHHFSCPHSPFPEMGPLPSLKLARNGRLSLSWIFLNRIVLQSLCCHCWLWWSMSPLPGCMLDRDELMLPKWDNALFHTRENSNKVKLFVNFASRKWSRSEYQTFWEVSWAICQSRGRSQEQWSTRRAVWRLRWVIN